MTATSLLLQANTPSSASKNVIEMRGISTRFGDHVVHENLDLDVKAGEIFAIVGGSGSGKSSLLREMIMLDFLVDRHNGWIYAKTYSRRGVRQADFSFSPS